MPDATAPADAIRQTRNAAWRAQSHLALPQVEGEPAVNAAVDAAWEALDGLARACEGRLWELTKGAEAPGGAKE